MNTPIGITYLRPVVGSLSAIVAAILLCVSNHANAQSQSPPMLGIMYLESADSLGDPIHDWSRDPALTNPYVQGIALRTHWDRVEPHEHASPDDFYWDYLDQGVALAAAHGKKVSISVTAGVTCPQWLFDAGSPAFYVTEEYGYSSITDGITTAGSTTIKSAGNSAGWDPDVSEGLYISGGSIPAGATIVTVNSSSNVTISAPATQSATGVAITTAKIEPMPLPWDPIFQQKWGAFIQAFAARYGNNPNLAYVVMGGPGRRQEAYFCFTDYDMDYFNNTLGGLPNWEAGVKWIIDQYGTYFPNTPFMLGMGDPIPTSDGDASLEAVVGYGMAQHPGNHFGVMSCGLQANGPGPNSNGAEFIPLLCPTSTVGFQFYIRQGEDIDPVTGRFNLDLGLERGFNFGAHFIEVYSSDCDDPVLAPVLTTWGALLTTTPPIPTAPSGLTATATSSSTIDLGWVDNANNEIEQGLERSVGSNSNYVLLDNVDPNVTAFTDTQLIDGTKYYYRVRAFNTGGFSAYSNERSAITTLKSPNALTAIAVSSSQISLTWTDNSAAETGFKIERSPVDDLHFTQVATVGANVGAFTDSGLAEGTKYYYRVRAYNTLVNSGYTSEKNATTLSNLPLAPSGLTASVVSSSKITLAWTDNSNNETGFIISRKTGSGGTYADIHTTNENITTWSDTTVVDGTQYYYKVRATNSAGDSPNSNEVNGIALLAAPTAFTATAISSSQISLSWTDNSAAETGFKIERSPVDDLHFTQVATVGANVGAFTDSGLTESTKYYYRVRAYNAIANSTYTSEKNATTLANVPAAPSGLTVTSTTSSNISLAWTDNSGNEQGFRIQRKKGATGTYTEIATRGANITTYSDNDSTLLDGTQYYYKICAYNTAGNSAFSTEVSGTTLLAKPTSATATAVSRSQINLTWVDNSATETGYKIERKKTSTGTYAQIAQVGANVQSYSDTTGLEANTTYYYRIRATNGTLNSDYSNEPHAKTLP